MILDFFCDGMDLIWDYIGLDLRLHGLALDDIGHDLIWYGLDMV